MRYFFDTEFDEGVREAPFISIGIVSEDGRECHFSSASFPRNRASEWVAENVFPYLSEAVGLFHEDIARKLREWVTPHPQFWAYYAAHDWVFLNSLFGGMMRLPVTWPNWCFDLKQLAVHVRADVDDSIRPWRESRQQHNALHDARWARRVFLQVLKPNAEALGLVV